MGLGLHKRGNIWWISYQGPDGNQRRESTGSRNRALAEKLLTRRRTEVIEGRLGMPSSHAARLKVWADDFLLASGVCERTKERYASSLLSIHSFFGNVKISEISPDRVSQFQQFRLAEGVAPATVNRDRAVLSRMLNIAKKRRHISSNPCEDVEPLNEKRTRRRALPFTYAEERKLTATACGWFRMLFILLVETGMRSKKEALPLKWVDVHFDLSPSTIFVKDSKTEAGIRPIYLTEYCKAELLQWRKQTPSVEYVFPSPWRPGDHIRDYQDTWESVAKAAKIEGHIFYDTRATYASRINACGQTEITIARMLGHESTKLIPVYAKPIDENTRSIIEALNTQRNQSRGTDSIQ